MGFRIVCLEVELPTVIRRTVSAAEAVFQGEVTVEGLRFAVQQAGVLPTDWSYVPVWVDPKGAYIRQMQPQCVVDAIIA
ncbi:MAG TPA: hypothetical protein DCZ04_02255, partial [Syntrophorhabdus aromaticivorans]|nr:hypothetical protein [Syntrophorhabdus aromaticivorans]